MALPLIESRATSAGSGVRINLTQLQDEIQAQPKARGRHRSSSRDSRRMLQSRDASGHSERRRHASRDHHSPARPQQNLGVSHVRAFPRSKSGNDLRALVTNRNLVNSKHHSDDKLNSDVTGRPPLSQSRSTTNLLRVDRPMSRSERANSQYSLFANPRSSIGTNSTKPSPVMRRKFNHVNSHASLNGMVQSNVAGVHVTVSGASTPQNQRKFTLGYSDSPATTTSRPSTAGSKHSTHSNSKPTPEGHTYRDVRVIVNSDKERVTESNISRKEKVIHIVHVSDDDADVGAPAANIHRVTDESNGSSSERVEQSLPVRTDDLDTHKENNQTIQKHTGLIAQEIDGYKVFVTRDTVEAPPTPRVGLSKDGEGLSMDVFMRCVDWLDGVHKAHHHKSLDAVTLPPIEWND